MSSVAPVGTSQDPIVSLAAQLQAKQASGVSQASQDVYKGDTFDASTYIGDLHPNQDRLNVFATLDPTNESQTFYRFNLNTSGQVRLGMLVDQLDDAHRTIASKVTNGVQIELLVVMGDRQQIVADSRPDAGAAYQAWQQLNGDGLHLRAAKYIVRAYRDPGQPAGTQYFYSFQLAGGRYSRDFDTITHTPPRTLGESVVQQLQTASHKSHTGTDPIVNLLVPGTTKGASTDPLANLLTPANSFAVTSPILDLLGQTVNLLV